MVTITRLLKGRTIAASPTVVAWFYALAGAAWIVLSDAVLELITDPGPWQTVKGLGFVAATALSLYLLIRHAGRAVQRAEEHLSRERQQRYRAEADLAESRHVLDVAGSAARLGCWIYDAADGGSLRCSDTVQRIIGLTPQPFDGTPGGALALVHPDDRERVRDAARRALAGQAPMRLDVRLHAADGAVRWVHVEAAVLEGEPGAPPRLVGILQDITERRAADEALQHARKVQALGQLTGNVAHDFNNVLTIILGRVEDLTDADDAQRRDAAAMIQAAAERGARLTGQLLAFARRQVLAPRTFDANTLVRSMESLLVWTAGRAVQVDLRLAEDLWPMTADPQPLETALVNLAFNARDAMPDGGTLTVETANAVVGEQPFVRIRVHDTGEGMAPDVLRRAIEPFFTTKEAGSGTGLGLSQVYGFVRQSDGLFHMDSAPGAGTTVTLYFPRAATV